MTKQNIQNDKNVQAGAGKKPAPDELDPGLKYLANALKSSFVVLKVIMIALIGLFILSGFETVGSDEQALVLRFGRIRGAGEKRVLGPGLKWVFPYPIEQIIKIPVEKKINLRINSFWYFQTLDETLPAGPKDTTRILPALNPVRDGYCIVRGQKQGKALTGHSHSDYNIVHCKWQLTYKIDGPELFFKNVYVEDVKPGENYLDVIIESVTVLLKNLIEDAVVTAMVNYTADDALRSQDRIPGHVKRLLQDKLDKIQSGIKVVSIQLDDMVWPRQVDQAFLASIRASQEAQRLIKQAQANAQKRLNEAAGTVAAELHAALNDKSLGEQEKELLWVQLAGNAQGQLAEAHAYRTKVVENAKANADYLRALLPEYRKRPRLVVQKIYQDAIEHVLNNADEKIIIQPTKTAKGTELRILINRDPKIRPRSDQQSEQQ